MKPDRKTFLSILAGIVIALCGLFNCAKADTMNTHHNNMPDIRQEKIVMIAAFTANGDLSRLKPALQEGLDSGLSVSEIREILIQLYAYTGFPRSLNGIQTFMDVIAERKSRGIHDPEGEMPAALPPGTDRDAYGEQVRMKLAGITTLPPKAAYQLFAPGIDTFLKEHLFADIFGRGVLDFKTREIATVSAAGRHARHRRPTAIPYASCHECRRDTGTNGKHPLRPEKTRGQQGSGKRRLHLQEST